MSRAISVSAAMIVRNEARFLKQCLESLHQRVDEIIVVDTGSTDATMEIAAQAGARVLQQAWTEDFAAARNTALEAASSDWILSIDADERLSLPNGGVLGGYIDPDAIAAHVRFRPKTGYTRYRETRLFRRDPRIRFAGRIHETPAPAIRGIAASEGLTIQFTRVEIDHFGYDGDQSKKHQRNLPLLESSVIAHPERVYYWHHLAETLLALGRKAEAEEAGEGGLAAADHDASDKQSADASMIIQLLARLRLERGENPLALIDRGLARLDQDHALWFLRGRALLEAGEAQEALQTALRLRNVDVQQLSDGLLAFDQRIFRDMACELAALACLRLNRRDEAADYFAQAAQMAPGVLAYRVKAAALTTPHKAERGIAQR